MSATIVSMRRKSIIAAETVGDISRTIDQNTEQQFKAIAIRYLISKLDRRLIPFLILVQISACSNRTSIGHAKVMGIELDLLMTQSEKDWIISISFLAYLIFGIPSNLLLRFIGPTRYIALSMIAWGSLTVGMAFVTNTRDLLIIRFFLGISVCGFFPSIVIYFSLWYRKREQTIRIAVLYAAFVIGSAINCIVTQYITLLDGNRGLNDWQWTFLLEGLPNIPLGIITYLFLSSIPDTVQWLNSCEKQLLTNFLQEDAGISDSEFTSCTRLSWRQVHYTFIDWRIYLYAVLGICNFGVINFLTMYLPSLVLSMGHPKDRVHFMTAPLYTAASIFCLLVAYSSSRRQEHSFHLAFCLFVALLGFILTLALFDRGIVPLFVGICIACCGTFAACPLILSWMTHNVGGHTKRTIAIGFVVSMGQIPGIVSPQVYRDVDRPIYRQGHLVSSALLIVGLLVTFILRFVLILENRRRVHLSPEQHDREAAIEEPCDWHPDILYSV